MSWFSFFYFNWLQLIQRASTKGIFNFSWNFRCSAKESVLLLCSSSTPYVAFSKYKVSWFYFSYFNLPLLTESAYVKFKYAFWRFRCSAKEAVLLLLSLTTLYEAIWKCIMSWFMSFSLNWLQQIRKTSAKVIFSWSFRLSAKEEVLLLRSWRALYILYSRSKVSWF